MSFYQDIKLLPGSDIDIHFLLSKVFLQLHLALVELKDEQNKTSIGISFPDYQKDPRALGDTIRIFSIEEKNLIRFDIIKWLERFHDYVYITGIRQVPPNVSYAIYSRQQSKSSKVRIARRKAKRENISFEEAQRKINTFKEDQLALPYIHIKSLSSMKSFYLFINKKIVSSENNAGFSTYGFSNTSTVPDF